MNSSPISRYRFYLHTEILIWTTALVLAYFADPANHHMTLCPIAALGFEHCPGCGLGRSMSLLMHGDWKGSLAMHPLGWFGLSVIVFRIYTLIKKTLKAKTHNHGQNDQLIP